MNTSVATLPTADKARFSLTPTSIDEAMRFADMLSKSALVPKDYQGNPANCVIAMQWGMEIGLQPMQAMQSIAVINGRPAIWGDAMIALVKGSGLLDSIDEDVGEDAATCTVKRRGEQPVSRTFSMADAKRAGLAGKQGPWTQYPRRMMQMRARAWALRDVFPDVLRGVFVADEAQDMPPEHDITPPAAAPMLPPAASKTEAVKRKIAKAKGASLDAVLADIAAAPDAESLTRVGELAVALTSEADKQAARTAWANKQAEFKRAAAPVDADTGDVAEERSYAEVADALHRADDVDALDVAADSIRFVRGDELQAELRAMYQGLRDGRISLRA